MWAKGRRRRERELFWSKAGSACLRGLIFYRIYLNWSWMTSHLFIDLDAELCIQCGASSKLLNKSQTAARSPARMLMSLLTSVYRANTESKCTIVRGQCLIWGQIGRCHLRTLNPERVSCHQGQSRREKNRTEVSHELDQVMKFPKKTKGKKLMSLFDYISCNKKGSWRWDKERPNFLPLLCSLDWLNDKAKWAQNSRFWVNSPCSHLGHSGLRSSLTSICAITVRA